MSSIASSRDFNPPKGLTVMKIVIRRDGKRHETTQVWNNLIEKYLVKDCARTRLDNLIDRIFEEERKATNGPVT